VNEAWLALVAVTLAYDCERPRAEGTMAALSSPADASGVGSLATRPSATTRTTVAWRGSYTSTAGGLYIPPDWKDVHWRVKETTGGIGEGAIALRVDPANGRVLGALEGPLGPATIDGLVSEGKLTATVARKDPADEGFTGTIVGSLAEGGVEGTMNVSLAAASAIRTATFSLSPDAPLAVPR
jgi:hypothetical protein